jgi:lauroyl/myristoyl acyltransferase
MSISSFLTQALLKILVLVSKLPYRWVSGLGRGLGFFAYLVAPRRRRIARKNLELCMPNLSKRRAKKLFVATLFFMVEVF